MKAQKYIGSLSLIGLLVLSVACSSAKKEEEIATSAPVEEAVDSTAQQTGSDLNLGSSSSGLGH